jgi:hypothetical protein
LKLSVPVWTSTLPVLLKRACTSVVPVPALLMNVPALLTVPVNEPL